MAPRHSKIKILTINLSQGKELVALESMDIKMVRTITMKPRLTLKST